MKQLKLYQEEAITELLTYSKMFLKREGNETIVFQSPTGSGKTFMMAKFIVDLLDEVSDDLCFIWLSIGKGDLHKQSMKSVKREIGEYVDCTLLEDDFFGSRRTINEKEIVFVNWEKIRNKDRTTGDYKNVLMKDSENINFPEVLTNTREIGRKILLIIDESHSGANTQRAKELRDEIIIPELTIEMSATPVLNDMMARVKVNSSKVIDEGMIKKEIIINDGIDKVVDDELDSESVILESAYLKQKELKMKYQEQNSNVNPLVLIQLPNSSAGDVKKESVIKYLESKGITEENGKLAIWLSDEKINNESDILLDNDGKVEYLIFKQAIDTGWDCPRAQILVKFRETNSIIFEIQTVGRILRMPEAKHYMDDVLNTAYVYTNIQSITIKPEEYNPNIIKSACAKRKEIYTPTPLKSYYRNRVDFGDITQSFYVVFEHEFCKFFGIEQIDNQLTNSYGNMEKLRTKGVSTDFDNNDSILKDIIIKSEKIDSTTKIDTLDSIINVGISPSDLTNRYDKLIKDNLNGFAPKRSIPTVKQAILHTFRKYLGLESARGGIMYIQNMLVTNEELFASLISKATNSYKPVHEFEVNSKCDEEFNESWEIESSKNYNTETNSIVESKLSLYEPLYVEVRNGNMDQLELDFMKYLDSKEDKIEWFWKNGAEHMKSNFGIQKEDKSSFQPDFIIKFKDGTIGIFDTKAGMGFNENDNGEKSNALYRYISEERFNGKNIVGGLVIKDNGVFKIYQKPQYKSYKDNPEEWEDFNSMNCMK